MSTEAALEDPNEIITCHVTVWYIRRIGLLALAMLAMGLYFLYDGKWGYPKKNLIADEKERYVAEVVAGYNAGGEKRNVTAPDWIDATRKQDWVVDPAGPEPRWLNYASKFGLPAEPKKYSPEEIKQQFWIGGVMVPIALILAVSLLFNVKKTLVGHADHLVLPNGRAVYFADVVKVDTRKWENKGLAYIFSRPAGGKSTKKSVIDDMKFDPAGKVLKRLLKQFTGELITAPKRDPQPAQPVA